MKADAKAMNFITNEGFIRIPFFQRSYIWEKSNWEELFEDLIGDKYHFLGSLVFKQQNTPTGQTKEVLLIDGQQRLTTISILLKAIFNNFNEMLKGNVQTALFSYLYFKQNATDADFEVKIKHSKNDKLFYEKVLLSADVKYILNSGSNNKIFECYSYFDKRIKNLENDIGQTLLTKLFNKIIDFNYKLFVIIDLDINDDEQEIFDTINSSGVRLSSADIIKNAIFQKAITVNANRDQVLDLFTKYWENIFLKDKNIEKEWLKQRNTGRIKRDNIEILFHSYAVIKGFFDPEQHTLTNLSSLYKQYISQFDYTQIKDFLVELIDYAEIFYDHIITETDLYSFDNQIHRTLHIIEELELTTFYPLILFIIKQSTNRDEYLYALEKYVMRRAIANRSTKNYNKEVKSLIRDLSTLPDKASFDTPLTEVINGLQNVRNSKAALILFWVELYRRYHQNGFDFQELKYNYTLEHVMPKKWEEHWNTVPVYDETGIEVTDLIRAKEIRDSLINSIGNMTLLRSALNTSISNSNFSIKLNGQQRKKGIKHYADLSITKEIYQLPDTTERKVWDDRAIRSRNESLLNEIINIWN